MDLAWCLRRLAIGVIAKAPLIKREANPKDEGAVEVMGEGMIVLLYI
jgi:hypothetical protein